MEDLRNRWDSIYTSWITKLISMSIAFCGTYMLAEVGPLSPMASIIASAVAAIFCLWNPGGTAIIYIIVFFISVMHINSAMVGLVFIVMIIYCMMGYASVSILILTIAVIMSALPEGSYWGLFVIGIYFIYRCKEQALIVFYPIITSLMLIAFARFGTGSILYTGEFSFSKSTATDIDTFISGITFDVDSQLLMPNMGLIVKLTVFILLAAVMIWLVFRNKWLRTKISNMDICEGVMFAVAIIVVILLDIVTKSTLGFVTGTSYVAVILSVIAGFIATRPFASDKVAETLISKRTLKDRKDAALTYVAVKPKADWETPYVNEDIKGIIKSYDKERPAGVLIEKSTKGTASYVVDLIARHYGANIIKIDHDVFDKLYGEKREENFRKIFIDAEAQGATIICFNDADKFFYKVDDNSGEYVKRYHRLYMAALETVQEYENVRVCFVTEDALLIDPVLKEKGIIASELSYQMPDSMEQQSVSREEQIEQDKMIKKKTNRASAIAIILFLIAVGGLLYYFFVYENQQYDISETAPVETEALGYVYTEDGEVCYANKQVADIMTSNDATFYYLEQEYDGCYVVYQTDEATFNEMSEAGKGTILKKMCKSAEALFNRSYDNMPAMPLSDENNTNSVFDGHLKMGMCAEQLDEAFDGLERFFDDNELELSCDGMSATKLAYYEGNEEYGEMPTYFGVADGYVTTVNAVNDVTWIGFLAPVGETDHIQVSVCATYDKSTVYYGCERFEITELD